MSEKSEIQKQLEECPVSDAERWRVEARFSALETAVVIIAKHLPQEVRDDLSKQLLSAAKSTDKLNAEQKPETEMEEISHQMTKAFHHLEALISGKR
ncbi:hypothetical protein [Acetobacter sicerae]|uniref:hypothetical protein n=1 Tax=Acetobacter sicerae TaxID=85325 RepID=UPI001F549603|nr:hypothetical protein [Acetobacter sicerae]